ncbi:hypothetical protein PTKIN_Ptkin03bG0122600 [Pterospermum kingtungense]
MLLKGTEIKAKTLNVTTHDKSLLPNKEYGHFVARSIVPLIDREYMAHGPTEESKDMCQDVRQGLLSLITGVIDNNQCLQQDEQRLVKKA